MSLYKLTLSTCAVGILIVFGLYAIISSDDCLTPCQTQRITAVAKVTPEQMSRDFGIVQLEPDDLQTDLALPKKLPKPKRNFLLDSHTTSQINAAPITAPPTAPTTTLTTTPTTTLTTTPTTTLTTTPTTTLTTTPTTTLTTTPTTTLTTAPTTTLTTTPTTTLTTTPPTPLTTILTTAPSPSSNVQTATKAHVETKAPKQFTPLKSVVTPHTALQISPEAESIIEDYVMSFPGVGRQENKQFTKPAVYSEEMMEKLKADLKLVIEKVYETSSELSTEE